MRAQDLPDELATRPFTVAEGMAAGLSRSRMRAHDVTSPFHAVRVAEAPIHLLARAQAYTARMTEEEFFCSTTAAALYGVPIPLRLEHDERLHVAVPNPGRAPRSTGIVGHKYVIDPATEVRRFRGLRLSIPERAWCELAPILDLTELVIAGDHLIRFDHPLTTLARLRRILDAHPAPRGRTRLFHAIELLDGRTESPGETRLRMVLIRAGLTDFDVNYRVTVPELDFPLRIDIAFVKEKVAIEYQGGYHANEAQWRADMTRIARLESLGWRVIQVNKDDLRDPRELAERIRRTLAAHA